MKGLTSLLEAQKWKKIKNQSGFEQTEFQYRRNGWKEERRFTAIRQINEVIDTKETLFAGTPKIEYSYFCYVGNMKLTPWAGHKYYGKRATSENWIEWCKNQMASGSILTQDFWANSAIFQTSILAYNLLVWMMWLNDEKGFKEEHQTIRMILINVCARLKHAGRRWFLRLSKDYYFKERWQNLGNSIEALGFT
jgi:hypothetical protein